LKRQIIFWVLAVGMLASFPVLRQRHADEISNHRIALVVDWKEVRELADREIASPVFLLQALHELGIQGVLFSPLTLKDVVRGQAAALGHKTITMNDPELGEQALQELALRGMQRLHGERNDEGYMISRPDGDFSNFDDVEIGYDHRLLALCHDQDLQTYLRVNQDPWLQKVEELPLNITGVIFTTDDPPGGPLALDTWSSRIATHQWQQLLIEFKPTKAAVALARAVPSLTVRTHTIPTAELKDLTPSQELSRWQRAVSERSCRCLLFRPAPVESWADFKTRCDHLRRALIHEGWELNIPNEKSLWKPTGWIKLNFRLFVAFCMAAFAPILGVALSREHVGWKGFFIVVGISLAGGVMAAALADLPETRLEIIPFRGIKIALVFPWLISLLVLYPWNELKAELKLPLTRLNFILSFLLLGVLAYGIVRSGNSAPAWRAGSEQGVRDFLEKTLNVRPRFKEFAVGYPLLLLAFLLQRKKRGTKTADWRPLMWVGLIGPISAVNTFCHLHSPLALAFERTGLGLLLGCMGGIILYFIYQWWGEKFI